MRAGSEEGFRAARASLAEVARAGGPASLSAAVEGPAPLPPTLQGPFAMAVVPGGACVERDGRRSRSWGVLPGRTAVALRMFTLVPSLWARQVPDGLPPAPREARVDESVREAAPERRAVRVEPGHDAG
ncbi:hypothetical protein Kpho02_34490 [Kitasatospora phosalacinea]|uniref:Uncharacterized protein n=1 Tax=Kitasatospora phosalacinea TaxID=2065 RepID=A0A9W6V3J1_9ACTN|nr:hypothetical protein [Kitasatospora phosalacinea]GLW71150.1 hypothetical protein Kpho02_34490 [Kitasatospora phosalacinea]